MIDIDFHLDQFMRLHHHCYYKLIKDHCNYPYQGGKIVLNVFYLSESHSSVVIDDNMLGSSIFHLMIVPPVYFRCPKTLNNFFKILLR